MEAASPVWKTWFGVFIVANVTKITRTIQDQRAKAGVDEAWLVAGDGFGIFRLVTRR
jgi:UDP-N-acetyl-D-mannosaminuronic acid transferase (WecB/TagA/CpsF family)